MLCGSLNPTDGGNSQRYSLQGNSYNLDDKWRISAQLVNLLDRQDHDIDYAYISGTTPTAAAAFTDVFRPGRDSPQQGPLDATRVLMHQALVPQPDQRRTYFSLMAGR